MKKPKIKLDSATIQAFLLQHVEKILLVVVIGLMVLLVVQGMRLPALEAGKTPGALSSKSDTTLAYVDEPTRWKEVSNKRLVEFKVEFNVAEKAQAARSKTDALAYLLPNTLSRPDFPKNSPRQDPTILAPEKLVVRAVWGPLAVIPKPNETDPLQPIVEDASSILQKKLPPKKKTTRDRYAGVDGGEYGPEGMAPAGGPAARRTARRRGAGEDAASATAGGEGGYGYGGEGGGYGGYGGGMGMMPGDRYPESMTYGFMVQNPEATIARNVGAMTVMALVPLQKQIEEFENKFSNALDYDPNRDFPWYVQMQIQRADVTDLDPADEIEEKLWTGISARALLREAVGDETAVPPVYPEWAGYPPEVVDPSYLDYPTLTHPAPPFMNRDLWDLLTHPDVPLAPVNMGYGEYGAPGTVAGTAAPGTASGGEEGPSLSTLMPPGGMAGGMGGPMMPGMGSADGGYGGGGYGGVGGGYGGAGGYGARMPGMGMGSAGMGSAGIGSAGMPGMGGYGRPGGYGGYGTGEGGDGGYGGAYGGVTYTPPKYKLIRFTDTKVERGRKYRYRVRVLLNDPNHPAPTMLPPSLASLAPEVQKRVKQLDAEDAEKSKKTGRAERTFWVTSPWSEPSPVAELPPAERVLVAKVPPKSPTKIRDVPVQLAEPSAEVCAVMFDPTKVADIPAEQPNVVRGAVLNFTAEKTKVIHPVTKEVVDLEKQPINTDALVADLMGGDKIPTLRGGPTEPLTALGEMLIVDSTGKLRVQNEARDIEMIRRFTLPKEDPAAKTRGASPDGAMPLPGEEEGPRRGRRPITGS